MMLAEGEIEDTRTGGTESFRVCEKPRKISEVEEKPHEYRNRPLSAANQTLTGRCLMREIQMCRKYHAVRKVWEHWQYESKQSIRGQIQKN